MDTVHLVSKLKHLRMILLAVYFCFYKITLEQGPKMSVIERFHSYIDYASKPMVKGLL